MRGCRFYVTDAEGMRKAKGHPLSRRGYNEALRQARSLEGSVALSCAVVPGSGEAVELALCDDSAGPCKAWTVTDGTLKHDRHADTTVDKVGVRVGLNGVRARAKKRR